MAKYKLNDIAPIQQGDVSKSDRYWILNLDMVESNTGKILDFVYCKEDEIGNSTIKFDTNNVLYSKLRPYLNKVVIPYQAGYATSEMLPLRPDTSVITREYLTYFLRSPNFVAYINEKTSGAKMPRANSSDLKAFEVDCPELSVQNQITSQFDKLLLIIDARHAELQLLDDLIKARFVEMFGDAVHNDRKWKTDSVENLCKEIYGGGTPSKSHDEYYENGTIPWVSSKDMKTDVIMDSQIHITQLGLDNSTARMVPANSVIMVIRSGILKHTLPVAINAVPITVNQDLKVLIPGDKILTRFFAIQLKMHERDILSGVRAVTADNIEFNALKQRQMIVPPLDMQYKYVDFIEQVDKSKYRIQFKVK